MIFSMFSGRIVNWSNMKSSGKILWWVLLKRNRKINSLNFPDNWFLFNHHLYSFFFWLCTFMSMLWKDHTAYFIICSLTSSIVWRWWCPELRSHYRILNIHILLLISKLGSKPNMRKKPLNNNILRISGWIWEAWNCKSYQIILQTWLTINP